MQQTEITDSNRLEFYKQVYRVLSMNKDELLDLNNISTDIVIFDSAGWYYEQHFPKQQIIKFENLQTCKNYKLTPDQFDHIFTDTKIPVTDLPNCILVLDHSDYLKYKNIQELRDTFTRLTTCIKPKEIIVRMSTINLTDSRFENRIQNLASINPINYTITKFNYNEDQLYLAMREKYDIN